MKKHLSNEERAIISNDIKNNKTIKEIAINLNRSISTISREIKRNRILKENNKKIRLKNSLITSIENHICPLLKQSPYVCNGCSKYINKSCTYDFVLYDNLISQNKYKSRLFEVKTKNKSKYENILHVIQERLDMGQPIKHILHSLNTTEIPTKSTIYNLINSGKLKYKKKRIKLNKSRVKEEYQYVPKEKLLHGKTYMDFVEYISINQDKYVNIAEIDLLCGSRFSNTYVLSIFIPSIQFLILRKIKNKKALSVIEVFDDIERKIGTNNFKKLFGIMIADRGSEFLKSSEIEKSIFKGKRTKIFYCNASSPYQKPNVENIHRIFRRYIPKGVAFDNYIQDDFDYIASNINSLIKEKYKNKTPNEMFLEKFPANLLKKLSLEVIKADEICIVKYLK